jgi:hypothetical protein
MHKIAFSYMTTKSILLSLLTATALFSATPNEKSQSSESAVSVNAVARRGMTSEEWKRLLTVSLNAAQRGTSEDVFEQSVWYTVGRTNPYYTGENMHTLPGAVTLTLPEGTLIVESLDNPFPNLDDKKALKITYDLEYPVSLNKGAYSIVLNGALPLPTLKAGNKLSLQVYASHNVLSAKTPGLTSALILNTFGGSILSDQMARLALSYGPTTDMVRTLPPYTIEQDGKTLKLEPSKVELIAQLLKTGTLEHTGYTDKAKESETGFALNHKGYSPIKAFTQQEGYPFSQNELDTGLYSFEIRFLLPLSGDTSVAIGATDRIKGEIYLTNLDFIVTN